MRVWVTFVAENDEKLDRLIAAAELLQMDYQLSDQGQQPRRLYLDFEATQEGCQNFMARAKIDLV